MIYRSMKKIMNARTVKIKIGLNTLMKMVVGGAGNVIVIISGPLCVTSKKVASET